MSKLNYSYKKEENVERPTTSSVDQAKTGMSKQAVVNLAISNSLPTNPGGGSQIPPAQTVGFGRTR